MTQFICKTYSDLSKDDVYAILKLRQEVFVVEQQCCYLDADSIDQYSRHLMILDDNVIVSYMRIIPKEKLYKEVSFGRILVKKTHRGIGLGKEIVNKAIDLCLIEDKIIISAQSYLKRFYEDLGFSAFGEEFLEDEIPHIKMLRS